MARIIAAALLAGASAQTPVQLTQSGTTITLSNGCVQLQVNLLRGSVDTVMGRFECDGRFDLSNNVAANLQAYSGASNEAPQGISQGALAIIVSGDGFGHTESSTAATDRPSPLPVTIVSNSSAFASFIVGPMLDTRARPSYTPRISTNVTFSLAVNDRSFGVNASTAALIPFNATVVRFATSWWPASAVSIHNRGVRQGFNNLNGGFLGSTDPLVRWYSMGYGGGVDITPVLPVPQETITFAGRSMGKRTGMDIVLAGGIGPDNWKDGFENDGYNLIPAGPLPDVAVRIAPNQYDFPPSGIAITQSLPVDDMRAIYTAVFGSPMGALHSYDYSPEVRIAPCIDSDGGVCYGGLYNFFDPDSFISVSAMLTSFDPIVMAAVKGLLETNGRFLCPAGQTICEEGQAMHHFVLSCSGDPSCVCTNNPINPSVQDCVTYQAISGAVQTGPNIFWTWAALRYAATSGNFTWLSTNIPLLRSSMSFLLNRFDASVGLFKVPGSLMIDTFIRANYTSDTNSAMVLLLGFMADAETFLGNSSGASMYKNMAATVVTSYNKYLLAASGDHYCTNSNPTGTPGGVDVCARDFVDYDSNLLAVAAGIPDDATAAAILARVDGGACTHPGGATYVSEIYYDSKNCQSGNTGDSAITMGRIAWMDGLARQRMGDAPNIAVFNDLILGPLQADLLTNTWLYERYTCSGTPTHNSYYIEMPEIVAMLLAEIKYGVSWTFTSMRVAPLVDIPFTWVFGAYGSLSYAPSAVTVSLNYASSKTFTFTGMTQGAWTVTPSGGQPFPATVGADGVLTFQASTGAGMSVTAKAN